jgi:hypothetical protein
MSKIAHRRYLLPILVLAGVMVTGCNGTGTLRGRVILPVSAQTGRPAVAPDQVCKLVRIEIGTVKTVTCGFGAFAITEQRFTSQVAPVRFETGVYDARAGTCTYATEWPAGSYAVRASYIYDGAAAFNVPGLTGPTWEPALASGEIITARVAFEPIVITKDRTLEKDFTLIRINPMSRASLIGNSDCK